MKVKFGLTNVHYAIASIAADGSATFGTPKRIPGAVSLTMDAVGDPVTFYADNVAYFKNTPNAGYEGTLEVALLPDQFRKDILGDIEDSNGVLSEDANAVSVPFALLFQFEGDTDAVRYVMYNCTASRPSVNGQTKEESIEVQTEELSLNAGMIYIPSLDTSVTKAKVGKNETPYANWFASVYQAAGVSFAVNESAVEIAAGGFKVVTFTGNSGAVTAASSNADVIANVSNNQVAISVDAGASAGATVTLTDEDSHTATITVTLPE